MGARKIPIGIRTLTADFYSFKNRCHVPCESLLERDFYLTLEFKKEVLSYKAQPVRIHKKGRKKSIYPDSLVTFTPQSGCRPLLVEVKDSQDLDDPEKATEIKLKAASCREYAENQGWDFQLVTDKDIRGVRLDNYKFLYKYTTSPSTLPQYRETIILRLTENGPMSVTMLMEGLFQDKMERSRALRCLWHLVRAGETIINMDKPLTNSSMVEVSDADA
ncbi:MAG: TnsA endonuclease N-terminal domain-containing protein [Nitrospirae bacterium]|nr:TnsA endonuclease N-terminal domain-containing protein [Nitrospirota bacterium]